MSTACASSVFIKLKEHNFNPVSAHILFGLEQFSRGQEDYPAGLTPPDFVVL